MTINARGSKLPTGIPGLDGLLDGGIPANSINIITGPPGVGKTILTQQIIYTNANLGRRALYLTTLSEPTIKMLHYLQKFTFFSADAGEHVLYLDLGEVIREKGPEEAINMIVDRVHEYQPNLLGIDSFKAIYDMSKDPLLSRKFSYDLSVKLATWGVTGFFVGEYTPQEIDNEPIFAIADGIIEMSAQRQGLHYHRFINVLKMRGENVQTGMHPFEISEDGLRVYHRIQALREPKNVEFPSGRISTGVPELDDMLHGGIPAGTATMLAGGAGTGKTLLGLHFAIDGAKRGEPGVIVTFQETPEQLRSIAHSFGWDLKHYEDQGLLCYLYHSPVELQPDIHASHIRQAVNDIGAQRIVIDSIKDIEIATPDKTRYRDYVYALIHGFKQQGITTLMTNEIPQLFGAFQISEHGVSFIADNLILLRYVESMGSVSRALNVLKVRGSPHSKMIREFRISNDGIRLGKPIKATTGILIGSPVMTMSTAKDLPPRTRFVMESLQYLGTGNLGELSEATGIDAIVLQTELDLLQQNGLIFASDDDNDNGSFYQVSS